MDEGVPGGIFKENNDMNRFGVFLFLFLGLHLRDMDSSRLGVESELQLLAYTTATATPDPSHVCVLHHNTRSLTHGVGLGIEPTSSWDTSRVLNLLSHNGNSRFCF